MGRSRRTRLGPLAALALLGAWGPPAPPAAAAPEAERSAPLTAATLGDPDRVPVDLVRPLADLPALAGVPAPRSLVIKRTGLSVDWDGDGRLEASVRAGRAKVLHIPRATGPSVPVLAFDRLDAWWVAPAALRRATLGPDTLELLDADLDGRFDGPADRVRWAGGAFFVPGPERLLASGPRLLRLSQSARGETGSVTLTPEPAPPGASPQALRGLGAVNGFRNRLGLAPLRLNLACSAGCERHAEYIRLNPVDGFGHSETPGRPGYSPEGLEAAIEGVMERSGDPARAVERLTAMMLHRTPFLCDAAFGLGVGTSGPARGGATTAEFGPPGFSVLRAGKALASRGWPVVCPGPGQSEVPRSGLAEQPTPEPARTLYDRPRGYPISVSFLAPGAPAGRLTLRRADRPTPVPSTTFSPQAPVHPSLAHNYATVFLVAEEPLEARTLYEAAYVQGEGPAASTLVWRFSTGDTGP